MPELSDSHITAVKAALFTNEPDMRDLIFVRIVS